MKKVKPSWADSICSSFTIEEPKVMLADKNGMVRISDLPKTNYKLKFGDQFRVGHLKRVFTVVPDDYAQKT